MKYVVKDEKQDIALDVSDFRIIKTQTRIAYGVLIFCASFLIASAVYGAWRDDFSGMKEVLLYMQAPVSFILGYYFRGQHDKTEDHTSSNGAS